jgi:multidrug resistance efflux pump
VAVKEAELAAARAAVEEARASHKDYATQYALVRDVTDHRAVSRDDVEQRKNAELLARAKVDSAVVAVASAQAALDAARTALELLTVRAPIDAEVLQVNVRAGEYAATGVLDTPLVRLGDVTALHVRTDIDENDAWRFTPGTRAVAFIRGNRDLNAEMRFVRVEPYVVSKTQLAGTSTERVDTGSCRSCSAWKGTPFRSTWASRWTCSSRRPPRPRPRPRQRPGTGGPGPGAAPGAASGGDR